MLQKNDKEALIYTFKNYKLSDHNFIVILIKITHHTNWMNTTVSKLNYPYIKDELASIDLENVVTKCVNVDIAFSSLIKTIKFVTENSRMIYKIRHR